MLMVVLNSKVALFIKIPISPNIPYIPGADPSSGEMP
jgi:hypothetical protein